MKIFILFIFISASLATLARRIIGGARTSPKPWVVLLWHPRKICGSTKYTESLVITAAHCDKFIKEEWKAYLNVDNVKDILNKKNPNGLKILDRVSHPHYKETKPFFDLSLWWIDGPSSKRTIVDLDDGNEVLKENGVFTVGWGLTKFYPEKELYRIPYEENRSDHLMKIHLKLMNYEQCCTLFKHHAANYPVFCARAKTEGEGIGLGDSGGPIYKRNGKRVILLGVNSASIDPEDHVYYGLNSLVSFVFYKDFIEYYVKIFTPEKKKDKSIMPERKKFTENVSPVLEINDIVYKEHH